MVWLPNDASKQYCIPARDLQSITYADLNKYINKKLTTFNQFKNHLIFGVWNWNLVQIEKHQNATVQLFLRTKYANTLSLCLFV